MAEMFYRLHILGLLPEVTDREAVRESVALLFKTTPEKVDVLLQQPTVLRKLFSRKAVDHLHATLLHAGVACEIEPADPEHVQAPSEAAIDSAEGGAAPSVTAEASNLAADGKIMVPLAMDPLTVLRPVSELPAEPTEADWRAFIGPHADYYLAKHRQMRAAHHQPVGARLRAYWHWPAFFWPPLWFWYRKLYLWALLSLLSMPALGVANGVWGSLANWLYYQQGRAKIRQMRSYFPEDDLEDSLAEVGGTLRWQEAVPQALGVSVSLAILIALLAPLVPPPSPPEKAVAVQPEARPTPPRKIQWVGANAKPIYVHQPPRLNNQPRVVINPYRGMEGVNPEQVKKQPQTPAAQTARRMSDIKRRLNDFLIEARSSPIPQSLEEVQRITELNWPVDGWNQAWDYQVLEYGYRLASGGADKQLGTEDDIWFEAQPRMPTFMRREQAAAEKAVTHEVQPLRVAPEE